MKYKIAVSWEMCGEVEIEANSIEEALIEASQGHIEMPIDSHYIDDSWQIDEQMSKYLNNIE